jgi:hypothetical protein
MDLVTVTDALAAQITQWTGLRALGQARDSVTPPCAVILPGSPVITYGNTMDEALSMNLMVLLIISDAAPVEMTQRALDTYLGIGAGEGESVPAAILKDPSLGGVVHWCEPVTASNYGRIDYAGVTYFGARINVTVGAI